MKECCFDFLSYLIFLATKILCQVLINFHAHWQISHEYLWCVLFFLHLVKSDDIRYDFTTQIEKLHHESLFWNLRWPMAIAEHVSSSFMIEHMGIKISVSDWIWLLKNRAIRFAPKFPAIFSTFSRFSEIWNYTVIQFSFLIREALNSWIHE